MALTVDAHCARVFESRRPRIILFWFVETATRNWHTRSVRSTTAARGKLLACQKPGVRRRQHWTRDDAPPQKNAPAPHRCVPRRRSLTPSDAPCTPAHAKAAKPLCHAVTPPRQRTGWCAVGAAYLRLGASRPYAARARRASAPVAGASVRRRASEHARLISHLAPTEHTGSCDGRLRTRLVADASSSRSAGADRQSRRRDQAASRRLFWLSGRAPSSVSTSTLALRRPQLRRRGGAIRQHARASRGASAALRRACTLWTLAFASTSTPAAFRKAASASVARSASTTCGGRARQRRPRASMRRARRTVSSPAAQPPSSVAASARSAAAVASTLASATPTRPLTSTGASERVTCARLSRAPGAARRAEEAHERHEAATRAHDVNSVRVVQRRHAWRTAAALAGQTARAQGPTPRGGTPGAKRS